MSFDKDVWIEEEDPYIDSYDFQELIKQDKEQNTPESKYKDIIPINKKTNTPEKPTSQPQKTYTITPLTLLASRMRKECTEELVKQINKKWTIFTTRDDEKSECWIYQEGIYIPEARTYIKEHIRQELQDAYTTHIANEVINKIEADTYIEQEKFFLNQDQYPHLLPLQNGIINIETKELTEFTNKIYFFNKLPITYTPEQDCPNIKKFLEEVLETQQDKETLLEFYGSCLLKEYKYEKMIMLLGKGRNGKGKTLELLKRMLGIENCAEISPQTIEEDQFAVGELFGKMANISGDINSATLQHTGKIKSITGRDMIMANRKFKTRIKFVNYAKMIFSANEIPDTKDLSDGFFSRWIVINFPYQFLPDNDIAEKSSEDLPFIKPQDPNIIDKITTQEELNGLFNLCLNYYHNLKNRKYFTGNQTIEFIRTMWIRKSNSVRAFMMECCDEDYDEYIEKAQFKLHYVAYCRRHKLQQLSDKFIRETLTTNYNIFGERILTDEKQVYVWKGVSFKNVFGV